MSHRVVLDWPEMLVASLVGCMRQISNKQKGNPDTYGLEVHRGFAVNVLGAMGEAAVAKHLDRWWSQGRPRADDVGPYQVRTSRFPNGDLILHSSDRDDAVFVLVTGTGPEFWVRGWIRAGEGKRAHPVSDKFNTGRPCHWIPQDELNPLESLPAMTLDSDA